MLIDPNDIERLCEILHRAGQKIVFTNGCFDILHAGHVRYLEKARSFGDCLVLGLNTDASVRGNKGPARPINGELDRAEVVEAFTLTQEGERSPLAGAVTNVRAASFPSAPQARAVTVTAVRANGPTADRPGQLER